MAGRPAPAPRTKLGYHRVLGPNASVLVSPICLGTMNFGDIWDASAGGCSKETAYSVLDQFYASGGNFIDTANMYMAGQSEEWLGDWMADRGVRDQMVIATKFTYAYQIPDMLPDGTITSNFGGSNRKSLRHSLEESLKRLKTDYIDIFYVHSWDGLTSIPDLMRALDDVVRQGRVLYLGCSNWPAWMVVKANSYAREHGMTPFVVYEGLWNVVARDIEREIVPMCKAEGMAITVWEALGGGKFKSKADKAQAGARRLYDLSGKGMEKFEVAAMALERVAARKGTTVSAVAMRYVMLKAPYVFPVIGARKVEHLQSNVEALAINLDDADIQELQEAVPLDLGYPHIILSGSPTEHVGPTRPTYLPMWWGGFEGVEEPKAPRTCSECRRRKIRCIYRSDSSLECNRCLSRGTKCVLPATSVSNQLGDEKRTLRERVLRLESLLQQAPNTILTSSVSPSTKDNASISLQINGQALDDAGDPALDVDHSAPFMAALQTSDLFEPYEAPRNGGPDDRAQVEPQHHITHGPLRTCTTGEGYSITLCENLRAVLPSLSDIKAPMADNTLWWQFWNQKTFGTEQARETLLQYTERVYSENDPIELGLMVSAYARHKDDDALRLLSVVDQMVISNDRFAGTLRGLTLIAFQAKCYLDIGQPRRAFLCNRRGVNLAQVMNIHRTYSSTNERSSIWWTLYQGDRFFSILLGLPYGIRDDQFPFPTARDDTPAGAVAQAFSLRLGVLMGKVIDHKQYQTPQGFSNIIDIEDELERLACAQSQQWWSYSIPDNADTTAINDFRERLLQHSLFFFVRMYVHMPYMVRQTSSRIYETSRQSGLDASRDFLRRYHVLSSHFEGAPLFECKTHDFLGFMSALLLLVGSNNVSRDMPLIDKTIQILERLAIVKTCKICMQAHRALVDVLAVCTGKGETRDWMHSKIAIPYFGTLRVAPLNAVQIRHDTYEVDDSTPVLTEGISAGDSRDLNEEQSLNPIGQSQGDVDFDFDFDFDFNIPGLWDNVDANISFCDSLLDLDQDWGCFFD
ncbi:hypothetical protein PV08_01432 [Exophiala spinifera]|uniref:Zn(2)-C6 fungal-type domain-containing protein n=1 Tax=Exophiala spinifera TaxID=91928 RepID=A0A0D2CBD2_9EURO|nr:uncharacterized protein PV08_01432 [Exophiala spinifera]KIW20854.1 hypothetical protein PV08_01432 [Exophiala spinifera]